MIIVTGAAGFIGSNIVRQLNESGVSDIIAVDDLKDGHKMFNLADCDIVDYMDKDDFLQFITANKNFATKIDCVFHQGACSITTEWDGRLMMQTNFDFSKYLLHYCLDHQVPLIYASSASVYGAGDNFSIEQANEHPINVYAFSKLTFDQYVRHTLATASVDSQVVGLRYFNVYGPREQHKGSMASVAWHFHQQLLEGDEVRLFEGSGGYGNGEQQRDFIYIDDVVHVNRWFMDHPECSGIYNLGTGRSQTFNDMARAVIAWHGHGSIRYIPFPEHLSNSYQSFTEADLSELRAAGFTGEFMTVDAGVKHYLDTISDNG